MGGYDEKPDEFAKNVKNFVTEGYMNMVGGCCGTTPDFIKHLSEAVKGMPRRQLPNNPVLTKFSGMTEFIFTKNIPFVNIGERCNISGSIAFKKLIKEDRYDDAISVAKE